MAFGHALAMSSRRPMSGGLGPEIAVNGTFADSSAWVLPGADWSIAAGQLVKIQGVSTGYVYQETVALTQGLTYRLQINCSTATGADNRFLCRISGGATVSGAVQAGTGLYSADLVAGLAPARFGIFFVAGFGGTLDNFSIRQVL